MTFASMVHGSVLPPSSVPPRPHTRSPFNGSTRLGFGHRRAPVTCMAAVRTAGPTVAVIFPYMVLLWVFCCERDAVKGS